MKKRRIELTILGKSSAISFQTPRIKIGDEERGVGFFLKVCLSTESYLNVSIR